VGIYLKVWRQFKGIAHPKRKILSSFIITLMSFQSRTHTCIFISLKIFRPKFRIYVELHIKFPSIYLMSAF